MLKQRSEPASADVERVLQQATLTGKAVVESHGRMVVPKVSKAGRSAKNFSLKDALDNLENIVAEGRRQKSNQLINSLMFWPKALALTCRHPKKNLGSYQIVVTTSGLPKQVQPHQN